MQLQCVLNTLTSHVKASAIAIQTCLESSGGDFLFVLPLEAIGPNPSDFKSIALESAYFFRRLANIFASSLVGLMAKDIYFDNFVGSGESLVFIVARTPQ